jgi:redox-sensitive bicupin YhaK (pirin superfamily)
MKACTCVGAQANNVSGIGWDFRFVEADSQHGGTIRRLCGKGKWRGLLPKWNGSERQIPVFLSIIRVHHHIMEKQATSVQTQIIPRTSDIGQMAVRRALPSKEARSVGSFVFWDQMGPGELLAGTGIDVRPHPHIGLATLTYLFSGQIQHRDSLGSDMIIGPGAANLMVAGSGIVHSERTDAVSRQERSNLFGIQSWLALPSHHEEMEPAFLPYGEAVLPTWDESGVRGRLVMGHWGGLTSPVDFPAETLYLDLVMDSGASVVIPKDLEERAVYSLGADIFIDGIRYPKETLLILTPYQEVRITAALSSRVVVLGGEPLDGPRHLWWNFVSSRRDRIEQAKDEWQQGRFASVPGETEWIPLPEA